MRVMVLDEEREEAPAILAEPAGGPSWEEA